MLFRPAILIMSAFDIRAAAARAAGGSAASRVSRGRRVSRGSGQCACRQNEAQRGSLVGSTREA
jgi:hypothetical protein